LYNNFQKITIDLGKIVKFILHSHKESVIVSPDF